MKIKLTDEQIDCIVIKDLKTQYLHSIDPEVQDACKVLLNFYNFDIKKLKVQNQ